MSCNKISVWITYTLIDSCAGHHYLRQGNLRNFVGNAKMATVGYFILWFSYIYPTLKILCISGTNIGRLLLLPGQWTDGQWTKFNQITLKKLLWMRYFATLQIISKTLDKIWALFTNTLFFLLDCMLSSFKRTQFIIKYV